MTAAAQRRDRYIGATLGLFLIVALALLVATRRYGSSASADAPAGRWITVRSDPPVVDVYVNGLWLGVTSPDGVLAAPLPDSSASGDVVEFQRDGYTTRRTVIAPSDRAPSVDVALDRAPVAAQIDSDPPGAAVWIAGEPAGLTPLRTRIQIDRLRQLPIRLSKSGYRPLDQRLPLPPPGGELKWSGTLLPEPQIARSDDPAE